MDSALDVGQQLGDLLSCSLQYNFLQVRLWRVGMKIARNNVAQ
jgi:hypothetical protein